jgi:hypothetical protein
MSGIDGAKGTMNKAYLLLVALLLLTVCHQAHGQTESDRIYESIKVMVEDTEAGWTCKRGQPIEHSSGMQVACHTSAPDKAYPSLIRHPRSVAFFIETHGSGADSSRRMTFLVSRNAGEYQSLTDLGDEAYGWKMDKADIVMRKGRFILWIHPNAWVENDPDAQTLNPEARLARRKAERLRLGPEFAKQASAALNSF